MSLTHVPLKKTGFQISPCTARGIRFVRTANPMLLHGGNFLKREARCIYHEGEFCRIYSLKFIVLYGDDEEDEKDQIAGLS